LFKNLFAEIIPKRADAKMYKSIGKLTLPTFLELFIIFSFTMVDMIMIGRLSATAMAGVGLSKQPFMLMIAVFNAVNVGTTTLVAWNMGAGNKKAAANIAKQAIMLNIILGLSITVIGFVFAGSIISFVGTHDDIIRYGTRFLQITVLSTMFHAVTMCVTAAFRACKQAVIPMAYNIGSGLLKVVLNFILIYGLFGFGGFGAYGAAWATVIASIVSAVIALSCVFLWKNSPIRIRINFRRTKESLFDIKTIRQMLTIGLPAAGEQFVIQTGLILFSRMINTLNEASIAAHTLVLNVNGLVFAVSQSFAVATTTLVGQSVGANDFAQAEKYARLTRIATRVCATFVALVCVLLGRYIATLYTNPAEEVTPYVIEAALTIFPFLALMQFMQSTQMSTAGALRGAGDTMFPLYSTIFGIWVFRVGACALFVFQFGWGIRGAWLAFTLDQALRSIIVTMRFKSGKWKEMKAIREQKTQKLKEKVGAV